MADFTFDTETPVETLDTVPSNFHHLYEEVEGGHAVIEAHRPVAETINALTANLGNSRKMKKQSSDESAARRRELNSITEVLRSAGLEADEITAEVVTEFVETLSTKAKGNSEEVADQLRNQRREMEASSLKAVNVEKAVSQKYRDAIDDLLIDAQATQAIAANKGIPALLLPAVKAATKVIEQSDGKFTSAVVDSDGETRFNGKGDPMTISEYVEELKGDPVYGRAFESGTPGGGGKQPGEGKKAPISPGARKTAPEGASPASRISAGLASLGK